MQQTAPGPDGALSLYIYVGKTNKTILHTYVN